MKPGYDLLRLRPQQNTVKLDHAALADTLVEADRSDIPAVRYKVKRCIQMGRVMGAKL
jgi:hypothetical protein